MHGNGRPGSRSCYGWSWWAPSPMPMPASRELSCPRVNTPSSSSLARLLAAAASTLLPCSLEPDRSRLCSPPKQDARQDGLGGDRPGALLPAALPAHQQPRPQLLLLRGRRHARRRLLRAEPVPGLARRRGHQDRHLRPLHALLSPMASPRHSSSSSRFSRGGHGGKDGGKSAGRKGAPAGKGWPEIGVIEEEGLLDDDDERRPMPKRCKYCLIFVGSFAVLFTFFALVLWGASRSQKPQIAMKSITFENFIIQAGTDASLVPTDMATTNSTVKFTYKNTGTFFGIHVTADPFTLSYSQLNLAAGELKKFYQGRSGRRTASVSVKGNKVPLYGSGPTLMAQPAGGKAGTAGKVAPVPMTLWTTLRSRAYVLGALVKPRFTKEVECKVVMDPAKLNKPISLEKACQYS